MKKIAVMAAALMAMGAAQAQNSLPLYGELGYSFVTVSAEGEDFNPSVLRGLLGYQVTPNLALEAMYGVNLSDDTTRVSGVSVKGEVQHTYGFYIKPQYAVTPVLTVFGRLGYAESKVKLSAPSLGIQASDSDNDVSYGLGLGYTLSPKASVTADYMSYYNKDGVKATGITLGLAYRF